MKSFFDAMVATSSARRVGSIFVPVTAIAVLSVASPSFAQNLLSNPGFESPTLGAWSIVGNGGQSTYAAYNGIGGSGELASYGAQFIAFNGGNLAPNAVLAQTFSTNPGIQYVVSFLYGNFNTVTSTATQAVGVSLYNGTFTATQISSSAPSAIVSQVFNSTVPGQNENFSTIYGSGDQLSFIATGTSTTLAFADQAASTTNSSDGALDNVSASAVAPEPSDIVLIAAGMIPFAGLVLRRRDLLRRA